MEITVDPIKDKDNSYYYDGFTVHVEDHRILTISTYYDFTAAKWLKEVQKTHTIANPHHFLIVGVNVDSDKTKKGFKYSTYEIIRLCIGSHCLLYHFADPEAYCSPKSLRDFFSNPKVIAIGVDMKAVARKLEIGHEIKFSNAVDVNELAVEKMKRHDLDLKSYSLDQLAKAVVGKHLDVVRPEKKVAWFDRNQWRFPDHSHQKVKYATVDTYLCFRVGFELLCKKIESPVKDDKMKETVKEKKKKKSEEKHLKEVMEKRKKKKKKSKYLRVREALLELDL